jgi:hypothetical protein
MNYPITITVNVNSNDYAVFEKRTDGNTWWHDDERLHFNMCQAFEAIQHDCGSRSTLRATKRRNDSWTRRGALSTPWTA